MNLAPWWTLPSFAPFANGGLSLDTAKAALIFEGIRRRPEFRRKPRASWQPFSKIAFECRAVPWPEAADRYSARLMAEFRGPCFVPPIGFSCRPADPGHQERAALVAVDTHAPDLAKWLQRLEACGLSIVAIDTKTSESIRFAAGLLEKRDRTFRVADYRLRMVDGVKVARLIGYTRRARDWHPEKRFTFGNITAQLEAFDRCGTPSDWMFRLRL